MRIQGHVKVDANPLKSEAFALSKWGLKSEIPGPDLACKDRVLLLPFLKYYSGNIIFEASRARAGRISKLETISKFKYQMTKTFQSLIQCLWGFNMF